MNRLNVLSPFGLPWPLPAVGAWGFAWAFFMALAYLRMPVWLAAAWALLIPGWVAMQSHGWMRRVLVLAGFPLSFVLMGQADLVPPWAWLLPLGLLLAVYPMRAWRDAPLFPTERGSLHGLAARLALPAEARILDAGCGLGHSLRELNTEWPRSRLAGVERSLPLTLLAALRCPYAKVRSADMWSQNWREQDLVYLFQRPETMDRAWRKAVHEMRPGAWLVSLEFEVAGLQPAAQLGAEGSRPVWVYRIGTPPASTKAAPSIARRSGR